MRELRRSPRLLHRASLRLIAATACLGLLLLSGTASESEAQAPRVLTLDDAGSDSRVDPILGMLLRRAHAQANLPFDAMVTNLADPDASLINFRSIEARPESPVSVMIDGTPSRAELESRGVIVGTVAGDVVTATLPLSLIPVVLQIPGVERISAASPVEWALNVSVDETDAEILWGGIPPTYPAGSLTGSSVIMGIVDTGVDFRSLDFKQANGSTRIKAIWDQTWTGTPPQPWNYGVEYSEAQINAGNLTGYADYEGHGTHIASVACGNGQATGNGQAAYRYVGVAPRADLVVVKASSLESKIVDAVSYVFTKAASLNKAAVVNLSMSLTKGGRDGTYSLDRSLSALTGPRKIITAAAGNRGLENGHAYVSLASGASTDITYNLPTYTPSATQSEYVQLEGWHDGTASFDVKLISPTGIQTAVIAPGSTSGWVETADGTLLVQNAQVTNQLGAKQIIVSVVYGTPGTARPRVGIWKVNLKRRTGTTSGVCNLWVAQHALATTVIPAFLGSVIDTAMTITSPGCADSVIATGSYTTKVSWVNKNGSTSKYAGSPPLLRLSDFSSRGPRRDGQYRPDVMAPGYGVMAGMTGDATISTTYQDPDGKHYMNKGTSVASAHTAGAVALLLEQNSNQAPATVRAALRNRARFDSYTGTTPNGKWGYGKLDMSNSPTTDVASVALGLSFRNIFPNPSADHSSFEFDLESIALTRGAGTPIHVRIVDVRGREVAQLQGVAVSGVQRLVWNGTSMRGTAVPAGVYFARLEVGDKLLERKFIRLSAD